MSLTVQAPGPDGVDLRSPPLPAAGSPPSRRSVPEEQRRRRGEELVGAVEVEAGRSERTSGFEI